MCVYTREKEHNKAGPMIAAKCSLSNASPPKTSRSRERALHDSNTKPGSPRAVDGFQSESSLRRAPRAAPLR